MSTLKTYFFLNEHVIKNVKEPIKYNEPFVKFAVNIKNVDTSSE